MASTAPQTEKGEQPITPVARPAWERGYARLLVATDAVAVATSGLTAWACGLAPVERDLRETAASVDDLLVVASIVAAWIVSVGLTGGYEAKSLGIGSEEYKRLGGGALVALATVTFAAFTFELPLSRGFIFVVFAASFVVAGLLRQGARKVLHRRRASGQFTRRVLVAGAPRSVADLVRHFRRTRFAGYSVVAAWIPGADATIDVDGSEVTVPRGPDGVLGAIGRCGADTVAVADSTIFPGGELRDLAWSLEGTGVDLIVAPAVTEVAGPRIVVRPVAGVPLLHVEEPSLSGAARFAKNAFDHVAAACALVLLSPLLLTIIVLVRATSRGPAIFRQTRVGHDGREFAMLKFRTMVIGAEEQMPVLRPLHDPEHVLFKLPEDPRVTRLGRWLRRYSLDELPQIWNILKGDMSVVGPRPPLPSEVERYAHDARRRLLVKPGLTGLWQVSGRADLSWRESVRLDLYYVENWSWVLDALILARTIPAVLRRRGAY